LFPFRIPGLLHPNAAELHEGGDSTNDEQPKHARASGSSVFKVQQDAVLHQAVVHPLAAKLRLKKGRAIKQQAVGHSGEQDTPYVDKQQAIRTSMNTVWPTFSQEDHIFGRSAYEEDGDAQWIEDVPHPESCGQSWHWSTKYFEASLFLDLGLRAAEGEER